MSMIEPFPHQKEGIEFLKQKKKALLADEMGLGKTLQAIIAAREDEPQQILVVCPASLKINWEREIAMAYPLDWIYVVKTGKEQTIPDARWVIVNYDMLPKYKEQILNLEKSPEGIHTVIIDEAHYIKSAKRIRSMTTLDIAAGAERVYALTGTPVMNRPIELFNILKAINHPLGRARTVFAKRYCGGYMKTIFKKSGQVIRYFDDKGATRIDELRELTKDSILRRLKKEVTDLPPKIVSILECEMSKEDRRIYDTAFDAYIEWLEANPDITKDIKNILDARHLVELTKLKQVCSRAKLERIVSDIRSAVEQGQKVIVFSQFTHTIMRLKEMLLEEKRGTQYDDSHEKILSVTLTGEDSMKQRQQSVDAFQNDENVKVFISNIKAGGVGITLTAASIVMFADMEWSPSLHNQAEDRAHRIGQSGTVNVYYYVLTDTTDEDIVEINKNKESVIGQLFDEQKEREESATAMGEFVLRMREKVIHR